MGDAQLGDADPTRAASRRRRSSRTAKLAVSAVTLILVLGCLELGLRIRAERVRRAYFEAIATAEAPAPGAQAQWRQVIQYHSNERIHYELKPGLDCVVDVDGAPTPIRTNRFGFRGPELELEKPPGVIRIVGLGDSYMFGVGLAEHETYLARLGTLLDERYPEKAWEVVNTAVGGYNTAQEVETLRVKGLRFQPDLVIVGLVANDLGPILYANDVAGIRALDRSFLLEAVRDRWRAPEQRQLDRLDGADEESAGRPDVRASARSQGLRWQGGGFLEALEELAALKREHGFELLCFAALDSAETKGMLPAAERFGLRALSFHASAVEHVRGQGPYAHFDGSDLMLSRKNRHPSAIHNELIANDLLEALERDGVIAALLERSTGVRD